MKKGEVFIYAGWSFPYYPFILLQNLKLKGAVREFRNAGCRNPSRHNYVHFSRPVTEEKSAEQLAQICILWLIPGGSQITDSIWMFKKLNLCWELLPSSLLLVFIELFVSLSVLDATLASLLLGCLDEFTYLHLQSYWSLGAAGTGTWVVTFACGYRQYLLRAAVSWII